MKIFVIGGCARSGKSTFGNLLKEELKDYGYKPCVMQITSPLYDYAENYFDYDPNRDPKPREFLQKMGIEIIKEKLGKQDFLLKRLYEDIEILSNFFDAFIITDARLINELLSIQSKYDDVVTIKLVRRDYDDELTEEEKNHITEKEISMYNDFDYIVYNTGLDSLKEEAIEIIHNTELEER